MMSADLVLHLAITHWRIQSLIPTTLQFGVMIKAQHRNRLRLTHDQLKLSLPGVLGLMESMKPQVQSKRYLTVLLMKLTARPLSGA